MRELFIYYRTQLAQADVLQAQIQALHSALRARHPGLQTRLMRRPEPVDGWLTWMETYALPHDPCGVTLALQREIEAATSAALIGCVSEPRHTEVFVACA
jgi:hypothetical protein